MSQLPKTLKVEDRYDDGKNRNYEILDENLHQVFSISRKCGPLAREVCARYNGRDELLEALKAAASGLLQASAIGLADVRTDKLKKAKRDLDLRYQAARAAILKAAGE